LVEAAGSSGEQQQADLQCIRHLQRWWLCSDAPIAVPVVPAIVAAAP
jgi:hypothetical protein